MSITTVRTRFARYYDTARTAHLERLEQMVPADFLYTRHRADWDEELASRRPDTHRLSAWQVARRIAQERYDVIEIPEPLAVRLIPQLTLIAMVVRMSNLRGPRKTELVTYAIENLDPIAKFSAQTRLPIGLSRVVLRAFWRIIFADLTRIAFGTQGALDTYRDALGRRWSGILQRTAIESFPALPSASHDQIHKRPESACFLGTFEDRKGILELLNAWTIVGAQLPDAKLTIMGKGEHETEVRDFAASRNDVVVHIDPPREKIRAVLSAQTCLVLLSKRTPLWREQVGLPIVEALEQGCQIVTTEETGIADWLRDHGHVVVPSADDENGVAEGIVGVLTHPRPVSELLAELPHEDSRYAADAWMFAVASAEADELEGLRSQDRV